MAIRNAHLLITKQQLAVDDCGWKQSAFTMEALFLLSTKVEAVDGHEFFSESGMDQDSEALRLYLLAVSRVQAGNHP